MLRLLQQPKELGQLEKRRRMADYQPFLGDYLTSAQTPPNIQAPLGSLEQYQAGFVDLPTLLAGLKTHFKQTGQYRMGEYPINRLKFTHSAIQWGDIRAQRVVFCEGYRGKDNPWFKHLPFQPVKGEILTLELDGAPIHQILNAGPWLIPIGGNHYRLGSTHEHHRLDETSTEKGKAQLIKGLGQLLKEIPHYRILDHRAGVRPATLGTDPFLGPHPQQPRLHIFNGFGAKGSLLIPWHACRYADYLAGAIDTLPDHAHITRFKS
jgi:glycine/D-amino acid oxidase-like deaminating enzyme